jgi:hypothetical protein
MCDLFAVKPWPASMGSLAGQEIGIEQGMATFHKIRAPSSFLHKSALFYWSL